MKLPYLHIVLLYIFLSRSPALERHFGLNSVRLMSKDEKRGFEAVLPGKTKVAAYRLYAKYRV